MVNELDFLRQSVNALNDKKETPSTIQLEAISNAVEDLIDIVNIINNSEGITKVSSAIAYLTGNKNIRFEKGMVERSLINATDNLFYGKFVENETLNEIITKYNK